MDTKVACCGCSGCGCFLIIIAVIVSGYFGFSFIKDKGRDFAAFGFKKTIENLTENSLPADDKKEVLAFAEEVKKEIEGGKIGLYDLIKETATGIEGNTYLKSIVLGFKTLYLQKAESGGTESEENAKIVNHFISGIYSEHIDTYKAASLTKIISQKFSEKLGSSSKNKKIKYQGRRLNKKLSPDKVEQSLKAMQEVIAKYEVPAPTKDFNAEKLFKQDLIRIMKNLRDASKKENSEKTSSASEAVKERAKAVELETLKAEEGSGSDIKQPEQAEEPIKAEDPVQNEKSEEAD